MSLGVHPLSRERGSLTGPKRIVGEKHSLIVETSVADFSQEYHRQASPGSQYFLWSWLPLSNTKQSSLPSVPEKRLPQVWHKTVTNY